MVPSILANAMTRCCDCRRTRLLLLLIAATTIFSPTPARADDQQAAVEEFRKGKQAYLEGRYEDAIRSYEKALALKYSAKLHYNIGLACEKLSQLTKARDAYARYLKEEPSASNADEVRQRVVDLEQRIKDEKVHPPKPAPTLSMRGDRGTAIAPPSPIYGPPVTIDVMTRPPAAEIFLDGQLVGVTPLRVNMAAGATYRVSAERRGYLPAVRSYTVRDRDVLQLDLAISPQGRMASMTRTEWFGLEPMIGGGAGNDRVPSFGLNLQAIGLRWRYFAWTIVELGAAGGGMTFVSFGTRPGFPIYLGARGQHQLRFGVGLAIGFMQSRDEIPAASSKDNHIGGTGLVISPSIDYRFQTDRSFYWGFALRPYVMATEANKDKYDNRYLPWAVMLSAPLGWSSRTF
jgi:tetratricopeptide (TPR) repeat protein